MINNNEKFSEIIKFACKGLNVSALLEASKILFNKLYDKYEELLKNDDK